MKIEIEEKDEVVEATITDVNFADKSERLVFNNLVSKLAKMAKGRKKVVVKTDAETK